MIIAAIPVKNNLKWTSPLVMSLLLGDEVDEIWIYDHGSTDATKYWIKHEQQIWARLKYFDASDMGFYDMWNDMILAASDIGGVKLAILNNDIRLPHMALKTMADNMGDFTIAYIDKERSSFEPITDVVPTKISGYWHRCGWAFMVDADFWDAGNLPIDPRFQLWYGDDYLYRKTLDRGGKICTMIGIGCDHAISQTPVENKNHIVAQDKELFDSLWT